jgi:rfaE bifunctional protein nucleotidyltransferase chain/domain
MRVVLCNGTFDPLHAGHLLHLEAARKLGDALWVSLTNDAAVRREKGSTRPLFPQDMRAKMLKALRCVDHVFFCDSGLQAVRLAKPAVFVKGSDYQDKIEPEIQAFCEKHGIEIRITDTPKWSATEIGNELRRG